MDKELLDLIDTIKSFSDDSRREYNATKEWTRTSVSGRMTIRVPVALLNRIDELAEEKARFCKRG